MRAQWFLSVACLLFALGLAQAAPKKIVLIAGPASHGPGEHEHNAGCKLIQKCLSQTPGIEVIAYTGWPTDPSALEGAAAVIIYSDGGGGHPALKDNRMQQLEKAMAEGAGFGCLHYAVEIPKENGGPQWLQWLGGYFETFWSVNPWWTAKFNTLTKHPVTQGVQPFEIRDEWYYHMRFQAGMQGVTPILSDLPPEATLERPDGPHSGNPHVREAVLERKEAQHVMWLYDRPEGGRGFGFTGAHLHKNWGNDNFRKVVLNAVLWIAKVPIPENGVQSTVSEEDLKANLDKKG